MTRRDLLGAAAALLAAPAGAAPRTGSAFLVGAQGPGQALLHRLAPGRDPASREVPHAFHQAQAAPDGGSVLLCPMRTSRRWLLADARTLEIVADAAIPDGWSGGGHALFRPDGTLWTVERREAAWTGDPRGLEGRVVIRDARSLRPLETLPSGGIRPHDLAPSPDPALVAVAHYGSRGRDPDDRIGPDPAPLPIAPGVALLDSRTGALRGFLPAARGDVEVRHLAVVEGAMLLGQTRSLDAADPEVARRPRGPQDAERWRYAAAPLARTGAEGPIADVAPAGIHALSMVADARHGEVLVGLSGEDAILVVDAEGRERRRIDLRPLGCQSPSGIGLIDDDRYIVCGHRVGAWLLERGTHRPTGEAWPLLRLGSHSHLSVAQA